MNIQIVRYIPIYDLFSWYLVSTSICFSVYAFNDSFQVLSWLKQWDSTVFGTDIRNTGDEVLSALRRHSSLPHNQKVSGTNFMRKSWGHRSTENYKGHSAVIEQEHNKAKGVPGLQNKKLNGLGIPDQKVSISNYGLSV